MPYKRRTQGWLLGATLLMSFSAWGQGAEAEIAADQAPKEDAAPAAEGAADAHDPVLEVIQTEAWRDYRLSPIDRRFALEDASKDNPFAITPHRPSYVLPVSYNGNANTKPFADGDRRGLNAENMEDLETKFQISLKTILWDQILDQDIDLAFAYTQQSYWQLYNTEASRPFRETVHEPELFLSWLADVNLLGLHHRVFQIGVTHQSNGQSDPSSRSWNRIFADFWLERGNFVMSIRPWYRLPEDAKDDDNEDIHQYLGYGELRFYYYHEQHEFSLMLRNNLRDQDNRGAVQLDWSFPLYNKIRGYVQYFNGYGESMIDYNHSTNRIGIGFMLINWM